METEVIPFKVTRTRKERTRSDKMSLYREHKIVAHTTVNGVGVVGRLRRSKKGKHD